MVSTVIPEYSPHELKKTKHVRELFYIFVRFETPATRCLHFLGEAEEARTFSCVTGGMFSPTSLGVYLVVYN